MLNRSHIRSDGKRPMLLTFKGAAYEGRDHALKRFRDQTTALKALEIYARAPSRSESGNRLHIWTEKSSVEVERILRGVFEHQKKAKVSYRSYAEIYEIKRDGEQERKSVREIVIDSNHFG